MRKEQRQCSSMLKSTTKPVDIYAPAKVVPTEDFCQCGVPWCKIYVEKWLVRVQCLNGHTPAEHLLTRTRLDQTERQMNVLRAFGIEEILKSVSLGRASSLSNVHRLEEAQRTHEAPTNVYKFTTREESSYAEKRRISRKENRRNRKYPHHSDPEGDW